MVNHARLRNALIAPVAAFAAMGAMTLVSPVQAAPAASSASSVRSPLVHKDRAHDVRTAHIDDTGSLKRAKKNRSADIVQLKASFGRKLVLTTKTRKAMPRDDMGMVARLTAGGHGFEVDFIRGFLDQENSLFLMNDTYDEVPCAGLKVKRVKAKKLVRLIIPARCIGKPKRVQVGLAVIVQKRNRLYVDDAFSRTSNGIDIAMGPWVRRR